MVTAVVKPAHRHSSSGNNAAGHFSRQTEEIAKDISSLAQNAAAIDESFEFVLRRMEKCKTQHPGMTKKLREDLDLLVDEWKKNHNMYREQLWKSYDLACKASVAAEDFADVLLRGVLLNSDITLQEKQDAVADYCKKVDSDILGAAELVDGFKQLLYQVESFKEQWKDVVRQNDISLSTGQIKAIDKEIVTLRNKIESSQTTRARSPYRLPRTPSVSYARFAQDGLSRMLQN
ncbi:hypothetical protein QCA50_005731 [Cerrena zonata]|uniref:Uncharacterized protein n=1 Tax=Cerrena zonata TaxID=2478898 RepID=A0AAW0GG02_9APHY